MKTNPKDFFLNLGFFIALYTGVVTFLLCIIAFIDVMLPDQVAYYSSTAALSTIRYTISVLIIVLPFLYVLGRILFRDALANEEKRTYGLRKWLMYLTMTLTGLTLAINAIWLINSFLGGELTARFVYKSIAVIVVALAVFLYSRADVAGTFYENKKLLQRVALGAFLVILISIFSGFFLIGSPSTQRALRFDEQRVNDLQSLQWQVVNHYQRVGSLPATLEDTKDPISGITVAVDPSTKLPYTYNKLASSTLSFELCATFEKASTASEAGLSQAMYSKDPGLNDSWTHGIGQQCFTRTIDPKLYPVLKQ